MDPTAPPLPTTARGRETRRRLVESAAELFFARGVASVGIDEILAASETSKSQLYHYFENRDAMVRAVVEYQRDRILEVHRPTLECLASWDDLSAWRDMIVEGQRARSCRGGCPLGSLGNDLAELDETARLLLAQSFARWEDALAQGLTAMVDEGLLRPDADPERLATATIASLQGGLLLAELARDTGPLEVALDAALSHIRGHAAGHPDRPPERQ
jgi:AcrR family transcriptional regulator